MRFGILPFPLRAAQVADVAVAAEELGFDSVWLGEHVIAPLHFESRYPIRSLSGADGFSAALPFFDPYVALAFIAARTSTLLLSLSVSVVPLHEPYHLARSIASIDQFSQGRFMLGIGAGWLREEFELVGRPWADRGRRLEETLSLLDALFNDQEPSFDGEYHSLPPAAMEPKPFTLPHPPYIFGGVSDVALRRAARYGDGWCGVNIRPDEVASVLARLRGHRQLCGRSELPFEVTVTMPEDSDQVDDALVGAFTAAGVHRIVIRPWRRGREAVGGVQAFADRFGITARANS
ncbi:MAG: luxA 2 [Acidimicrobiales bacterium]|nr:luxA 2 [Acidimicrobiales bacterium]